MPKKLAMPLMMALRIPATPLTTAMMQAPMVWKRDLIYGYLLARCAVEKSHWGSDLRMIRRLPFWRFGAVRLGCDFGFWIVWKVMILKMLSMSELFVLLCCVVLWGGDTFSREDYRLIYMLSSLPDYSPLIVVTALNKDHQNNNVIPTSPRPDFSSNLQHDFCLWWPWRSSLVPSIVPRLDRPGTPGGAQFDTDRNQGISLFYRMGKGCSSKPQALHRRCATPLNCLGVARRAMWLGVDGKMSLFGTSGGVAMGKPSFAADPGQL